MLVLGRKEGQVIEAGVVKVTVLEIRGGWVRLGIDAPDSVLIRRPEASGLFPVKEDEQEPSRISEAYPCHCCGNAECEDKVCCVKREQMSPEEIRKRDELRAAAGV